MMLNLTNDSFYVNYYKDINFDKLKAAYQKFSKSLTTQERLNFEIAESKNRALSGDLVRNMSELIKATATFDKSYKSKKWYASQLFIVIFSIVVVVVLLSTTNDIKTMIIYSTSLITLGFMSLNDDIFSKLSLSNTILQRTIESNRIFSELQGNGLSIGLITLMLNYDNNFKDAKLEVKYINEETFNTNSSDVEDELEEKLYSKLHLIFNLELMRFVTRSEIFERENELFHQVTKNSSYSYDWIETILNDEK